MSNDVWTIQRCLDWTRDYLGGKGDERPRLSAEWLLSSVTGLSRTELYMSFDKPLAPEELAAMHAAVVRRAKGEPLQYIAGSTTFRMIDVACEPGVLIPRPETELLVEEVLTFLDREVLDGDGGAGRTRERVELPWNAEVEAARRAERERLAQAADDEAIAEPAEGAGDSFGADVDASGDWFGELSDAEHAENIDGEGVPVAGSGDDGGSDEATDEPKVEGRGGAFDELGAAPVVADADGDVAAGAAERADASDALSGSAVNGAEEPATSSGSLPLAADERVAAAQESEPDEDADAAPRTARVLEVGCGTGCISLSLAHERAGRVACVATDIEPRAVALAERNREALGIESAAVDIRLGNLVSPLDRETEWGTFDVLVSNPPYIPSSVMETLPHEVAAFEPSLALDGGADGLDIFRRLVNAAPHMLRPGGLLACELYEGHLDEAASLCRAAGMGDVRIVEDLAHRPRIILARIPQAL